MWQTIFHRVFVGLFVFLLVASLAGMVVTLKLSEKIDRLQTEVRQLRGSE